MNNQPQRQRGSELDLIDGIDEQFQRLMKVNGNGRRGICNGRSGEDRLMAQIIDELNDFSTSQRQKILSSIRALKQKAE